MNDANEGAPARSAGGGSEGKTITMAMIAKAAGVSQGAISSLLNDRDYGIRVSPRTRERVFRVCREMGYVPNDLRAFVRMYPEKGDLCLLVAEAPGLTGLLAQHLLSRLFDELPGRHLQLAHYRPQEDYAARPDELPRPVSLGVASRFLIIGPPNAGLLSAMTSREHPAVQIGQEAAQPGVTSIVPDYAAAARRAIEHLFHKGHRHIAILSGPFGSTDPAILELNHGVRAGYESIKTPIEAQNVIYGEPTFDHGVASTDLLLDRPVRPTAVFCFNDLSAAGVLHRAQERGLKLPEELSVVGCGNAPFSEWLHPPLTTLAFDVEAILRDAMEELATRLRERDYISARRITVGSRMVERESVQAAAFATP